jgi:hypothetical protein
MQSYSTSYTSNSSSSVSLSSSLNSTTSRYRTPQQIIKILDIIIGRHTAVCANIRALLDLPQHPKVDKSFILLNRDLEELVGFSTLLTLVHGVDQVKEEEIMGRMMNFYGEEFGPMVQRFNAEFQGTLRNMEVWEAPRE